MTSSRKPLRPIPETCNPSPEEREHIGILLDAGVWFAMRSLRLIVKSDDLVIRYARETLPDAVECYGMELLLEMSHGLHEPESENERRIANQ